VIKQFSRTFGPLVLVLSTLPAAQGQTLAKAEAPPLSVLEQALGMADVEGGLLGVAGRYEVRFDGRGAEFVPVLGAAAPEVQTLAVRFAGWSRGSAGAYVAESKPERGAGPATAEFARGPGLLERFELTPEGLEHSVVLSEKPAGLGDLVLRFDLDGNLALFAQPADAGTWLFDGPYGDVHYGALTAIDAAGERVSGRVDVHNGTLTWQIDGGFVERASYPLTLDPLVSTPSTLVGIGNNDTEAETAADEFSARQLVVWKRQLSATSFVVRGQALDFFAVPQGPLLVISSSILTNTRPRVATLNSLRKFVVVWVQDDGLIDSARAAVIDAASGAVDASLVLDVTASGFLEAPDVCSELLGSGHNRVYAVWHRVSVGIRCSIISPNGSSFTASNPATLLASTPVSGTEGLIKDISLQSNMGVDRRLGIGYLRRTTTSSTNWDAYMSVFDASLAPVAGPTPVYFSGNPENGIELDQSNAISGNITWTVAVASDVPTATTHTLLAVEMRLSGNSLTTAPGTPVTTITTLLNGVGNFSVSTRPGKSLIAYETLGLLPFVNLIGLDSVTNQICDPAQIVELVNFDSRPTIACLGATLGAYYNTVASLLWNNLSTTPGNQGDIRFQAYLLFNDSVPNWTDLGGGCGPGGYFDVFPAGVASIGNGYFVPGTNGITPTATVAVLNIAAPQAAFPCGTCQFLPYEITFVAPVVGGSSSVILPIPCKASLVGQTVHMQYTVLTPAQGPCSLNTDFSLSNRVAVTIGT
jgi:hypothetical protein